MTDEVAQRDSMPIFVATIVLLTGAIVVALLVIDAFGLWLMSTRLQYHLTDANVWSTILLFEGVILMCYSFSFLMLHYEKSVRSMLSQLLAGVILSISAFYPGSIGVVVNPVLPTYIPYFIPMLVVSIISGLCLASTKIYIIYKKRRSSRKLRHRMVR
jgi:uncharacterized membrane protein YesL